MKRVAVLLSLGALMVLTVAGCATKPVPRTGELMAHSATASPISWQHPEVDWTVDLPSEDP